MAVGILDTKNIKRQFSGNKPKKTTQGRSVNTKYYSNKRSKLYKKRYRGQGR